MTGTTGAAATATTARGATAGSRRVRRRPALAGAAVVATALATLLPAGATATAQDAPRRVGDAADPVLAAIDLSREVLDDGTGTTVLLGRADVFADDLAATGAMGDGAVLLLTDAGAPLRPEVAAEIERALGDPRGCGGDAPEVLLLGGRAAVATAVEDALEQDGRCVARAAGASRVETAVAVADATAPADAQRVLLARSDDWADAAAVSAYAAATRTPVLVTPREALHPAVEDALRDLVAEGLAEVVLLGGEAALSTEVEDAVAEVLGSGGEARRVAGAARDATATAIVEQLWVPAGLPVDGYVLANGYADVAWAYAIAVGALAAQERTPVLYAQADALPPATVAQLDARPAEGRTVVGPAALVADDVVGGAGTPPPDAPDLDAVRVRLEAVASLEAPIDLVTRPGTEEVWVAERAGRVRVLRGDGSTSDPVLDIADTVSTDGERGLLGIAFDPDGDVLYTSSTDPRGDSSLDAFAVDARGAVDEASRRQLLRVEQPANNHNGGDVAFGPDGHLYLALGDGGGGNDEFATAQDVGSLLGKILRIDPDGGVPYAVPADNPFVGRDGADEIWALGLRNPWRIAFDAATGDLWIGDVGQGAVEEIDVLGPAEGGANLGWSFFEGSTVFCCGPNAGEEPPPTKLPAYEYPTGEGGTCAVTGGVVYRGSAIPALRGAYVFGDFCGGAVQALALDADGRAAQARDLGIATSSLVGFGEGPDGEVYVLSLAGEVSRIVPA